MNFYQCTPKMVENRTEDVFFEEYYTNGPVQVEVWLSSATEGIRINVRMKYLVSLADLQCLNCVDYRDRKVRLCWKQTGERLKQPKPPSKPTFSGVNLVIISILKLKLRLQVYNISENVLQFFKKKKKKRIQGARPLPSKVNKTRWYRCSLDAFLYISKLSGSFL